MTHRCCDQWRSNKPVDEQPPPALREVVLLAMVIGHNASSPEEFTDAQRSVMPHLRNPAAPSPTASTDVAMKIASASPGFAETDEFFRRLVGFDHVTIARVRGQMWLGTGTTVTNADYGPAAGADAVADRAAGAERGPNRGHR